jgi:hypothetical protein
VSGVHSWEGAVITRDRLDSKTWRLRDNTVLKDAKQFVIQTNFDLKTEDNYPESDKNRLQTTYSGLSKLNTKEISVDSIF